MLRGEEEKEDKEEKMIKDAQQKTGVFVNSHSYTRVRNTTDAPLIMILTENCGAQQRWTAVGTMSKMQGNGDTVATHASQDDLRSLLLVSKCLKNLTMILNLISPQSWFQDIHEQYSLVDLIVTLLILHHSWSGIKT